MICILTKPATEIELYRMARIFGDYIKIAVDIERGILAGGGESHADCEAVLLDAGSLQQNIWGAGLNLTTEQIEYDSIINIRPRQGNRSMLIEDVNLRLRVAQIVNELMGGQRADR